ncbi:MAG: T9SS type A sorting domain-containing protein [Reichenbachiella sp.]|uniref:T9SS type A sorting domain-containing protein n=1 Tax=Reichenbachiella sp. TaxID=2184521 RepID=UPI003299CFAE
MKTNKLLKTLLIFTLFNWVITNQTTAQTTEPKVYMHYMAWFGSGPNGNHWSHGTAQEPLIGHYNSQSWATHMYHILLSSACGIDGMVINVRTQYDETSFKSVFPSLQRIIDIDSNFDYQIGVSYDDQDRTQQSAELELQVLRDEVLPHTNHYIYKDGQPVIFIWNYAGYLSSTDYRNAVSNVFTTQSPVLLRNEIDFNIGSGIIDSYYPWVQGYTADGSEWGAGYLNWYYQTLKNRQEINFSTGAVWPGFDDRQASWGQNRWIDRRAGNTYNDTWNLAHANSSDLDWIIIETWNDWNEGTEIEPSVIDGFKYVEQTATNIAQFKGNTFSLDTTLFSASTKIYEAASLIEAQSRDSAVYYTVLEDAISSFIAKNASVSIQKAEQIIYDLGTCTPPTITFKSQINGGSWLYNSSNLTVQVGDAIIFSPESSNVASWNWTGPNNFSSNQREIQFSNLTSTQSGSYVVNIVDNNGCTNNYQIDLTVDEPGDFYYIVDRWQGSYLYDAGSQVGYSSISTNTLYQWKLLEIDGHYIIQNANTGDFINIQNLWSTVECTAVPSNYWSAHWALEDHQGFTRLKNRWQGTDYINIENLVGFAERSAIFEGAYSSHWTFVPVTGSSSRVREQPKAIDVKTTAHTVYPNPVRDQLNIEVNTEDLIKIRITNQTGMILYHKTLLGNQINDDSNLKIDVSNYERGLYIISIEQAGQLYYQKMIKE